MEEQTTKKAFPLKPLIIASVAVLLIIIGFIFKTGAISTPQLTNVGSGDTHVMVFDGDKYSPENLEIKVGDTIEFQNKSDKPFWPASNIHPTHGIYPEFDPQDAVLAGDNWSFKFDNKGVWRYHDHLYPYMVGVINVK